MVYEKVEIIWRDITHLSRISALAELKEYDLMEFCTIGYLLENSAERIVICGSYVEKAVNGFEIIDNFREVLIIPKKNIKELRYLER